MPEESMPLGKIDLANVVEHCKQLPEYCNALPVIDMLQSIAMRGFNVKEIAEAIDEIRNYFRIKKQQDQDEEPKKLPPTAVQTPEMPELKFFRQVSDEQAPLFKGVLRECLSRIDMNGKKEWFCIYAAWRYLHRQRTTDGGYVDFFVDIDALFPGLLKDLRTDLQGNRKYKPYCDMLSNEYKRWAVDNGVLPPMQAWRHSDWTQKYNNSKTAIKRMQTLISNFYTAFADVLKEN